MNKKTPESIEPRVNRVCVVTFQMHNIVLCCMFLQEILAYAHMQMSTRYHVQ